MITKNNEQILKAVDAIIDADALVILAGAGMGIDSGLPDFRGKNGFWRAYPMLERQKLTFTDMACPEMFARDPKLAWGFYGQRLNLYRETVPHKGFNILKTFAEKMPLGYFVFTSNVDGQFQKAGFDEEKVYECHGSIHHLQTLDCGDIIPAGQFHVEVDPQTLLAKNLPVNHEGELLRPNILMFDDFGWNRAHSDEQQKRYRNWLNALPRESKLVLIEIGAGLAVPTVRMESRMLKNIKNATYIQINPNGDHKPNIRIALGALDALSQIRDKF